MYNLPEMRAVNARFWEALRGLLLEAGLRDLPEGLSYERPPVPDRIGPEVLFSQTCGYPLETIFAGQAVRLGTPCYAVPGCDGPTHCGLFIVPPPRQPRSCAICKAACSCSTIGIRIRGSIITA
jgi:hypothetical protein